MESDKDRFGETMRLVERAKEDIYFAERDRELSHRIFQQLEKLRAQLQRVDKAKAETHCPKCHGTLESYTFQGIALDRCHECGGMWLDKGKLESIVKRTTGRLARYACGEDMIERRLIRAQRLECDGKTVNEEPYET